MAAGRIAAYYTLSAASLPMTDLPPDIVRKLPRYPTLPAVRIGRLAVDEKYQRRGLGELLLIDAVRRSMADSARIRSSCGRKREQNCGFLPAVRISAVSRFGP